MELAQGIKLSQLAKCLLIEVYFKKDIKLVGISKSWLGILIGDLCMEYFYRKFTIIKVGKVCEWISRKQYW